ncbi:aminotransferase class IV-domain-containing protein [Rhodofomes roseus]|uniref:Aminotransferase class IV-domain-containing protein n=1 Tax=Rhodofomes roseus TaxID=34475 RepID=A0ABQ8KHP5_9APHY|nr:aminotransferase class IV-domain-containing protein [Rhodofomes roseus]KAH9837269.1 aminotransferase class IV-domain-containing protein [Rhodofomes roseus]
MDLAPDFHVLSSTRYDPSLLSLPWNTAANDGEPSPFLLLRSHSDRLNYAAQVHGWIVSLAYSDLVSACEDAVRKALSESSHGNLSLKLRILLSRNGTVTASAAPAGRPLPNGDPSLLSAFKSFPEHFLSSPTYSKLLQPPFLSVILDTAPTSPSLFTHTKTTHRPMYNAARDRAGLPPLPTDVYADVLLYTPTGEIMETSIRNIAFLRRSPPQWITPRAEVGCLPGVMRRWLLDQGKIVEAAESELRHDGIVNGEFVMTFNGVEGCRFGRISHSMAASAAMDASEVGPHR